MPDLNLLKAKVWIIGHRPQFMVLVAITVCLLLIVIISVVLIRTRSKRPQEALELARRPRF